MKHKHYIWKIFSKNLTKKLSFKTLVKGSIAILFLYTIIHILGYSHIQLFGPEWQYQFKFSECKNVSLVNEDISDTSIYLGKYLQRHCDVPLLHLLNHIRLDRIESMYRHLPVPQAFDFFDWDNFPGEYGKCKNKCRTKTKGAPDQVFYVNINAKGHKRGSLEQLLQLVQDQWLKKGGRDNTGRRILAIGGRDSNLSAVKNVLQKILRTGYFSKVYYEAKDIHLDGVMTLPIDFSYYIESVGEEYVRPVIENITSTTLASKQGVLAAWGAWWGDMCSKVDCKDPERINLYEKEKERGEADMFANQHTFIDKRMIDPHDYWRELSKYRFLLTPRGAGVQSPKWMEALAVGTIPITLGRNAAFQDLAKMGYPMVVVDRWSEITEENLEKWWQELSPKLMHAAWMVTTECYWSLLQSDWPPHIDKALAECAPPDYDFYLDRRETLSMKYVPTGICTHDECKRKRSFPFKLSMPSPLTRIASDISDKDDDSLMGSQ